MRGAIFIHFEEAWLIFRDIRDIVVIPGFFGEGITNLIDLFMQKPFYCRNARNIR